MSPLQIAIEKGCNEIAKELVKNGADLNAVDDAVRTPLYISVQEGNIEIARLLMDEGCNVNAQFYDTALHIAVDDGNYLMVSELLERGANANLKCNEGKSPFHLAVTKNAHTLLCHCMTQRLRNVGHMTLYALLLKT